jgi:hypothetical protein
MKYYLVISFNENKNKPNYTFTSNGIANNNLVSDIQKYFNINWVYCNERFEYKLNKLAELMSKESYTDLIASGILNIENSNINLYQLFCVDFVVKNNEPYVYRIHTNINNINKQIIDDVNDSIINILNL